MTLLDAHLRDEAQDWLRNGISRDSLTKDALGGEISIVIKAPLVELIYGETAPLPVGESSVCESFKWVMEGDNKVIIKDIPRILDARKRASDEVSQMKQENKENERARAEQKLTVINQIVNIVHGDSGFTD